MLWKWLTAFWNSRPPVPARSATPRARVNLERLEDRTVPALLPVGLQDTPFVAGLSAPTSMEFAPDGRLFVTQLSGKVRVINNQQLLPTAFLTLPVTVNIERGLSSIALDPNFETNGFFYVYYTTAQDRTRNRLSRFQVSSSNPDVADPNSETVMLDHIPSLTGYHNGGAMHFGTDGMLYLGVGDSEVRQLAQSLRSLNGKILRLDVDHYPNIIPPDNPFVGRRRARPEIWAYGFRNPFTMAMIPGRRNFIVNDVGENSWEEVDVVRRGGNYGWALAEGPTNQANLRGPEFAYPHILVNGSRSAAITGGVVYTGNQLPAPYQGGYFFSDYVRKFIRVLLPGHPHRSVSFARGALSPIDLDNGPDGNLYYLSLKGTVQKISPIGSP
jgi:glucose/arabinose dehydrogenase